LIFETFEHSLTVLTLVAVVT